MHVYIKSISISVNLKYISRENVERQLGYKVYDAYNIYLVFSLKFVFRVSKSHTNRVMHGQIF